MLPATTADRLLALGTVLGAVALGAVVALHWGTISGSQPAAAVALARDTTPRAVETAQPAAAPPAARTRPATPRPAPAPAPAPVPASAPAELTVRAAGGDSWLEVRAGDADGEQLFYGVLAEGEEQTFEPLPVWVRIGALGNVELRLGGSPVRSTPPAEGGVVEFVASQDGLAPVPSG